MLGDMSSASVLAKRWNKQCRFYKEIPAEYILTAFLLNAQRRIW
jgi:hypothetical protein